MAPYLRPRRSGGQGRARSRPANHLYYSMTSLLLHLRTHLARTHLLGEPGVALVAVSGGADSVALLDLLHTLTPELGLSLVVAHVAHEPEAELRGEGVEQVQQRDRKSTRLNSSHRTISYAAFCLKTQPIDNPPT